MFYDKLNNVAMTQVDGSLKMYPTNDCSGAYDEYNWSSVDSNDFYLTHDLAAIGSISAVGIDCIDFSNLPASTNMNVVSDVMKWNDGNSWAWIRLTQATPFHPTMMRVDYSGASSIGKFHVHSYQSVIYLIAQASEVTTTPST